MNQFDQHTAILALEEALVPAAGLVDSRTEADNLRFLVDIASLFNFYDQTNKINGNWSPFLLKDPVFLVASIAKTSFQKAYSLFINTCFQLEIALQKDVNDTFISNAFNQLFDQLTSIFHTIERWTYYMQQSSLEYNLRTYIIQQVKEKQSAVLWALLALKSDLNINGIIPNIHPVDTFTYENYDQKIWKESKGKQPYWTILGLPTSPCFDAQNDPDDTQQCFYIEKLTNNQLFTALYKAGKNVFAFYSNCISYAETELESVQKVPGHFPDTILLRTFTSLLKIYQTQFNSLSEKHLHFYYGDILKQLPKSVSPDTVFAACNLAKKTATFQLPKNTLFNASLDANKQAILFETTNTVSLNPASIANACTLSVSDTDQKLYLQKLPPVHVVSKNEDGTIKTWKTFGSKNTGISDEKELGITFASPLFFLAEAKTRTIVLTFTVSDSTTSAISEDTILCNLSTEKAWFSIPKERIVATQQQTIVTLTITLQPEDPAITAFTKNPDGYTSDWPLLKIVFLNNQQLQNPTKIETLKIDVTVKELQNFALYNDYGMLNAKKPFQPFGPSPLVDQNFMIGSAEIFSKPINSLALTVNWNPFPAHFNFTVYYKEYNDFLNDVYSKEPKDLVAARKLFEKILALENSFFNKITETHEALFKSLFHTTKTDASKLIAEADGKLKNAIEAQNDVLVKEIDPKNTAIKEVITSHNILLSYIITEEAILLKEVDTDGNLDAKKITETEQIILSKIIVTKNSITQLLTAAENSLSKAPPPKTKSVFKIAIDSIFNRHTTTSPLLEDNTSADTTKFQFSNDSFKVNFKWLQNGLWQEFYTNQEPDEVLISSETKQNLFFPTETISIDIPPTRAFAFPGLNVHLIQVDPALQKTPLTLTDKSSTGFLKMQLVTPDDGFGMNLYPKVISAIALFNARLIIDKSTESLVNPPNIPFIPTVNLFSGDYTATISYDFSNTDETYPLECFYNTPFENYKVYDTIDGIITKNTTIGSSPERDKSGKMIPLTALPFTPTFSSKGQLFLELQNVIAPANVSFYFELARTYTEKAVTTNNVSYSYLSSDGWKTLTSIADGTNGFTCSGMITIYIPSDITTEHETMPGQNFWIALGTEMNPDNFPQTSFLTTNGITLQRIVAATDFSTEQPQIKANVITSPKTAIPEISATVQPFSSFGGKAAETNKQMNVHVSTRLKTKDRLVTAEDYFNVIRLEFPEVYYSKTIYKAKKAITYVMKRVADASGANAFVPLLSECNELKIQNYIQERVSPFVKVAVENFELNYVKITAAIQLQSDEDVTTVAKEINNDINIYLSPWITSAQTQITIDTGLNTAQLAAFINTYKSVLEVKKISFQIGTKDFHTGIINYQPSVQEIAPKNGMLLVPSLENSSIKYHL